MKNLRNIFCGIASLILIAGFSSCEYDNFEEPNVALTGRLLYNGEPLESREGVILKLFQSAEDGFEAANGQTGQIDVHVNQQGEFNSLLFKGNYKMVINPEGGVNHCHVWEDFPRNEEGATDTLSFTLNENKSMEFNITPYYKFDNYTAFCRNDTLYTRFTISRLIENSNNNYRIRRVSMFVSPTIHVNNDSYIPLQDPQCRGKIEMTGGITLDQTLELSYPLKYYYRNTHFVNNYRNYAYVRVGIKLGISATESIYSKIIKIEGIPAEYATSLKE